MIQHPQDALHDIVDIGKVAPHLPAVEHLDRLACEDRTGEKECRHVGPAPGSIDGEEAQARARDAVKMRIGMAEQFVGALGGGI
jgi:hypothetical protein